MNKEDFVKSIAAYCREEMKRHHILASIKIAQACLESGWGQSRLAQEANNVYGLKGQGPAGSMTIESREYSEEGWRTVKSVFRKYPSIEASIRDHTQYLRNRERYQAVFQAQDYTEATQLLQEAGYATDPEYAQKLQRLIKENGWHNIDEAVRSEQQMAQQEKQQTQQQSTQKGPSNHAAQDDVHIQSQPSLAYVRNANLNFPNAHTRRERTEGIVVHHPAWHEASVERIHQLHLNNGWNGIGYHFYIRKNGQVWQGRPHWAIGAHERNSNSRTIGVCFEGNFHPSQRQGVDRQMPQEQMQAGIRLIRDLQALYPQAQWIRGHGGMSGASTSCPGEFFPLSQLKTRIAQNDQPNPSPQPSPSEPTPYAKEAWNWAKEIGITDGSNPRQPATREQVVTLIYRYHQWRQKN
ncbi:glucosaminidase domain-containing protein [Caldalkalibacillus salinus]|uniref:glucosaminidase domain-containing protein n=1 Tax=Caldalkalibacillus salinus TaxID=2803787 RepID=UPI001924115F|nr:glucosaminidase domain-containing protein [Caldalkalibacillus salinus]